jgi:hypothetical protein
MARCRCRGRSGQRSEAFDIAAVADQVAAMIVPIPNTWVTVVDHVLMAF